MSKIYAKVEDGLIVNKSVFGDDELLPGEDWLDVTDVYCDIGWPVVDGSVVPPPTSYHVVNSTHDGWVLPEPLDDYKVMQKEKIKFSFTIAISTGSYFSETVQKDINRGREHLDNVKNLIDYLNATDPTATVSFRCYDNSFVELTLAQLEAIKQEMISEGLAMYQKKWNYEAQIDAATTIDEILAVIWDG